jgi:AhpD family alkylhydroperoxidase
VAAGDQKLSDEQRELVAIGASIGAGCQPCVTYHLKAGAKAGVSAERLLAGVVNSELAAAEAAERLSDHARAQLGREVREPKVTVALDVALASLGGALGASDLANVERQLFTCLQFGITQSQLREAIELGRAVQENSTRMHHRAALDLLDRVSATHQPAEDAPSSDEPGAGSPNFVSMMAKLLALMDGCDSADLGKKMAQIFTLFESSCCAPAPAAAEDGPSAAFTPMSSSACDCSAGSFNCMPNRKENQK